MGARTRQLAVVASLLLVCGAADARWLFVAPEGSDANPGHTPATPLATIQRALEYAAPGDTVALAPGVYLQDVLSVRAGAAGAPIRILGPADAIVRGAGGGRIVELTHGFIELIGFTVDGRIEEPRGVERYRDKLVYVDGGPGGGITGVRLIGLTLTNAGDECVRLKSGARGNEIAHCRIERCGIFDFARGGGGKNGESIYIGTAPEQLTDPDGPRDASDRNQVHHNQIRSHGSECVDVKEGASGNRIEHNLCLAQDDPDAGGISVRGNGNFVIANAIGPTRGAGIRLGGDGPADGIDNVVRDNQLHDNEAGALKIMRLPQRRVCGNEIRQPPGLPEVRVIDGRFVAVDEACAAED